MNGDGFLTGPVGDVGGPSRVDARVVMLDQAFDPSTLHTLRADLQAHARQADLPEDLAGDLVLAVHELAANAIAHGAGRGHLRLWREPGALSCEITDVGPAARPGSARPSSGDPAEIGSSPALWPVVSGHGLWLAHQVASRLDLWSDDHGTRAVITFQLPTET